MLWVGREFWFVRHRKRAHKHRGECLQCPARHANYAVETASALPPAAVRPAETTLLPLAHRAACPPKADRHLRIWCQVFLPFLASLIPVYGRCLSQVDERVPRNLSATRISFSPSFGRTHRVAQNRVSGLEAVEQFHHIYRPFPSILGALQNERGGALKSSSRRSI